MGWATLATSLMTRFRMFDAASVVSDEATFFHVLAGDFDLSLWIEIQFNELTTGLTDIELGIITVIAALLLVMAFCHVFLLGRGLWQQRRHLLKPSQHSWHTRLPIIGVVESVCLTKRGSLRGGTRRQAIWRKTRGHFSHSKEEEEGRRRKN